MEFVLLAVIALVVLLGLAALVIDNRGWSVVTVAAAILLLFAAAGYVYLAARLGERERSWRAEIMKTQAEIDRIVGDGKPGGEAANSLAALRTNRDRWHRALAFVDTWRGRSWKNATLSPPRDGKDGALLIDMPSEESEVAPLAAGAEVAVFDDADVAEEGRFLGMFRVKAVAADKGVERARLTIVPASDPATPASESDTRLWTRDYDPVTVYESPPVDRWLAFHKTPGEGDAEADYGRGIPKPGKTSGEDTLQALEEQMTALEQHDRDVPENEWPHVETEERDGKRRSFLAAPNTVEEIYPGRYWAVVEFTENVKFTKQADTPFAVDDGADRPKERSESSQSEGEDKAGGKGTGDGDDEDGDGDDKKPLEQGAMVDTEEPEQKQEGSELGKVPTEPDPTAGAVSLRFTERRFKQGEQAEFDLQTALELQNDLHWAQIKRVIERRPLSDPKTAIRGAAFGARSADGKPVRAEGFDALRQGLLVEMESIAGAMARIKKSRDSVAAQAVAAAEQTKQLTDDQASWIEDVAAATSTAAAFDRRLRDATTELADLEKAIVRLGNLLRNDWATLTEASAAAK